MKTTKVLATLFLILLSLITYAQSGASLSGLQGQTQSAASGVWSIVKIVAYLLFAIMFLVAGILLLITLKANTVRNDRGDVTKPIMGFVTFMIAGVVGFMLTMYLASTFGYN
jgi:heme/copper-type cytochrome/quinol oxidase subunit 2